jgi:hypothetical protein
MFVGHLAIALAAKPKAPRLSLGWLMAGVTALDLLWPLFLLAGLERVTIKPGATAFTPFVFDSYPWTHSLVMSAVWGGALLGLARAFSRDAGPWYLLPALVMSHWVLDFASHAPDMPLWPGASPHLGLGLWYSIPATLIVEGALWIAGIAIYLRGRTATSWIGPAAFWSFVFVCTVMWAAGPWSPPPPSERGLALFALIGWLIVPWAALADRYYQAA